MPPLISVIIPSYNASADLRKCLEALKASTFDASRFEVVVIDDGSTDDTEATVAACANGAATTIRYLKRDRKKGFGPGLARNDGLAVARGRIIAFTDADCIPDADWLSVIAESVLTRNSAIVAGDIWCDDVVLFPWKMSPAGQRGVTANLAIDREKTGSGSFVNEFGGLVGEDSIFVARILAQGHRLTFEPRMRVCHPVRKMTLGQVIRRSQWRKDEVLLYKRLGAPALLSMHPFFQPRIFGRCSYATLTTLVLLTAIAAAILRPAFFGIILLTTVISFGIAFLARYYRIAIMYAPAGDPQVSFADRCKTLVCIAVYLPCFVTARIIGSWTYRYLLL